MGEPKQILVRATNWVGDAVMSLPAMRALRERYPSAHIAILAKPWVGDLYGRELCVDMVEFLRPEATFTGIEALIAQMNADSARARAILADPAYAPGRFRV